MKLLLPHILVLDVPVGGRLLTSTTSLSPLHPLEHHSDPVGASDRDLCHPNGVLCPLLRCVRVLPGSVLLPRQEEKQTLWQISEIIDFFFHA